jgi:hypothetical protein
MNSTGRAVIPDAFAAVLTILFAAIACNQRSDLRPTRFPRPTPATSGTSGSLRDLHKTSLPAATPFASVGRTDDQLRERLRHEQIFRRLDLTDRDTAERAVGTALEQSRSKIDRWLSREGGHPNLVVDYDGDAPHPIGRSLRHDADQPEPCSHATIVLRWIPPDSYYVLTSYPECR